MANLGMKWTFVVGLVGSLAACGGSSDDGLSNTGGADAGLGGGAGSGAVGGNAGAGGASGSAGTAGGGAGGGAASGGTAGAAGTAGVGGGGSGGTGGSAYTLDNFCQKAIPKICEAQKDCCTNSGFGHDQKNCVATGLVDCQKDIDAAKKGDITFNPATTDACLAAYAKYLKMCVISYKEFPSYLRDFDICAPIFEGKVQLGGKCDRDAQCASSTQPDTFISCDDKKSVCEAFSVLKESAPCELGDDVPGVCDSGLYCDVSFLTGPPYKGICKKATPLGKPCNKFNPYTLECGLGYYCNGVTGVCTNGKVGGAACANDVECQSFACESLKCAPLAPIVDQQSCTG
ncbi:MAG TPA: hypothetical protein PKD61_08780 [Polyangiaceae bacterium]|nr:hypothetical protein [Polyangiaceae bacterium]